MERLTEKQKGEIIECYKIGNITISQLGRDYNTSTSTVNRLLKKNKIATILNFYGNNKKYTINHSYFNIIDNEIKAYILGFFYADACNNEKRSCINLTIQERDKPLLDRINKEMESDRPLAFNHIQKRYPNRQNCFTLAINSKQISSDLARLGCFKCKSLTLKFPTNEQVPTELLRHFLRGMIDGDGSFGRYSVKGTRGYRMSAELVSTDNFCLATAKILKTNLSIHCSIYALNNKKSISTRRLSVSGTQQVYRLIKWLYQDAKIFLPRKMDNFVNIENSLKLAKLIS